MTITKELDCGDNSCHFAKDKRGMRTNGGCRCFSNVGFSRGAAAAGYELLPKYLAMLDEIERLQGEAEQVQKVQQLETFLEELESDCIETVREYDSFNSNSYGAGLHFGRLDAVRQILRQIRGEDV